jgi:hypothetical protein
MPPEIYPQIPKKTVSQWAESGIRPPTAPDRFHVQKYEILYNRYFKVFLRFLGRKRPGQRRLLFKRWKLQKIEEFLTAKANKANKHT